MIPGWKGRERERKGEESWRMKEDGGGWRKALLV